MVGRRLQRIDGAARNLQASVHPSPLAGASALLNCSIIGEIEKRLRFEAPSGCSSLDVGKRPPALG